MMVFRMTMARFWGAGAALLAPVLLAAPAWAAGTVEITDVAGRTVQVPVPVERVLLGEGRLLPALAILDREDPSKRLVGMMGDYEQLDAAGYAQWRSRFPALDKVPRVGRTQGGSFSDEQAIAMRPQVAIFGMGGGHGPGERDLERMARLEAAGTVIVFVDFRHDPLGNTPRSMAVLGRALGREARATEFNTYWQQQLATVQDRLRSTRPAAPTVFVENRVGLAEGCCETMVGLIGKLIDAAGGQNVAKGLIPGEHGTLNPEFLIARQPRHYIGTAIGSMDTERSAPQRVAAGAGVTADVARSSLDRSVKRQPFAQLRAVKEGRAHSMWHHFYNSPFNVAALQAMAKWFHPALFADVDPRATLADMYRRFQPIPLQGEYWAGLTP